MQEFVWENPQKISTHSLTRRLTICNRKMEELFEDFNSQPHKEADQDLLGELYMMLHFNSQPHKEADVIPLNTAILKIISTHSLTRRLTKGE